MPSILRTATPMGDWRSFKFTHDESGVTYTEGQLYKIQETIGVLFLDIQYDSAGCKKAKTIVKGDEGVLVYHIEKVIVDKAVTSGDVFLPGDKVFWSGIQGDPVTPTWQTGYYWIGIATEPAAWATTTVEMDLKGDKATLTEPI